MGRDSSARPTRTVCVLTAGAWNAPKVVGRSRSGGGARAVAGSSLRKVQRPKQAKGVSYPAINQSGDKLPIRSETVNRR